MIDKMITKKILLITVLLAGIAAPTHLFAATPEKTESVQSDSVSLDDALGEPSNRYVSTDAIVKGQARVADYRHVTTLPEFERYSSKGRWNGNSATTLLTTLQQFKGVRGSTSLRTMWRHILLSDLNGLDMDGKNTNQQQVSLFTQRLNVLNKLGFFDEAVRLYQAADTGKYPIPESVAEQGIDAMALAGSADAACLEVNLALGSLRSDAWLQDGALCAAYFGQTDKADTLYKSVRGDSASGFRAIYKLLRNGTANGGTVQIGIPPLWRTLLLAKGANIGFASLSKVSASDLAAIAVNRHVPFGTRLAAGEKAAAAGTISADLLRKLYDEQGQPSDAELQAMLEKVKSGEGLSRAKIYQAARFIWNGNDRATIVDKAVRSLPNMNSSLGGVYHWIIVKLTLQKTAIAWFAPTGYVALKGGNRGDAKYYYEYGDLGHHYVSFLELFSDKHYATPEFFIKWRKDIKKRFPNDAAWRIDTAMALAHMLGVPDTVTDPAVTTGPTHTKRVAKKASSPDSITGFEKTALWHTFQNAVAANDRGNSVAAALNLFADRPWHQFQPLFFKEVFDGLYKTDAKNESLKLGLEIGMQTVI